MMSKFNTSQFNIWAYCHMFYLFICLLVGTFTKSHVLSPKINILTPKCWTSLSSNVVLVFKWCRSHPNVLYWGFAECHIGTWGGFNEWASHFRSTCSYWWCGSYKYLDYGLQNFGTMLWWLTKGMICQVMWHLFLALILIQMRNIYYYIVYSI